MNEGERDRPRFIERVKRTAAPEDARQNRSNAMVTLGLVLFLVAGLLGAYGTGRGPGVLLFGMLGVGLVVGGLVIRR